MKMLILFRRTLIACTVGMMGHQATAATVEPTIPLLTLQDVTTECAPHIKRFKSAVSQLEQYPLNPRQATSNTGWFKAWNRFNADFENYANPIGFLSNVAPDAAFRKAADDCQIQISQFNTDLYQNRKLYEQFKASRGFDAISAKLRRDMLTAFEDTGINLTTQQQARYKAIVKQLEEQAQTYDRNVRDNDTRLTFSPAELKGLPQSYIDNLKKDAQGNYLLGFEYPEYQPFMRQADDDAARKRYYYEFTRRGGQDNLTILKQMMDLRYEMARLFGYSSYADFVIRNNHAKSAAAVNAFLESVKKDIVPLQQKELLELQQFKAKTLGIPMQAAKIQPWDISYWSEKYRKTYFDINQEALRDYFPTEASLKWLLATTEQLYGLKFTESKVPTWSPEVRYLRVTDSKDGHFIGGLYLDLYPREGKYGHAAVWSVYGKSTELGRTPVSALVTNFNRKGLTHDELETFVHEFGHAMHGLLSDTRYTQQSGTSVERDFVEAPSQMYEEWSLNLQSLGKLADYCSPACPRVDAALQKKLVAAHNYGQGSFFARQLLYAQYDMKIHGADAPKLNPMTVWRNMEAEGPLGSIDGNQFPGQFGHLVGGYGAGYYGYMWSQVVALDMLSAFGNNLMDPKVGARYRQTILSQGSQKPAEQLIRDFLGRNPSNRAFLDEIAGKRLK